MGQPPKTLKLRENDSWSLWLWLLFVASPSGSGLYQSTGARNCGPGWFAHHDPNSAAWRRSDKQRGKQKNPLIHPEVCAWVLPQSPFGKVKEQHHPAKRMMQWCIHLVNNWQNARCYGESIPIERYKAAFIMRGTAVAKGGVKAVKNGITIPNRRNHSQLPFKLWPDFFMFMLASLLHLIKHLSFKEPEF